MAAKVRLSALRRFVGTKKSSVGRRKAMQSTRAARIEWLEPRYVLSGLSAVGSFERLDTGGLHVFTVAEPEYFGQDSGDVFATTSSVSYLPHEDTISQAVAQSLAHNLTASGFSTAVPQLQLAATQQITLADNSVVYYTTGDASSIGSASSEYAYDEDPEYSGNLYFHGHLFVAAYGGGLAPWLSTTQELRAEIGPYYIELAGSAEAGYAPDYYLPEGTTINLPTGGQSSFYAYVVMPVGPEFSLEFDLSLHGRARASTGDFFTGPGGREYVGGGGGNWHQVVSAWGFVSGSFTEFEEGDLNADGKVDYDDYLLLQEAIDDAAEDAANGGSGYNPIADLNFDGMLDENDIAVWEANNTDDLWINNVTISGTSSTHDPYSFDTVVGSGEQLRTVPVGGANRIEIEFNSDVNEATLANALDIIGLQTGTRPVVTFVGYDDQTFTATWDVQNWSSVADHYAIRLNDTVAGVSGIPLDGEWTNPLSVSTGSGLSSEFPSGDGSMGGDFYFVATILPGDANRDNVVNFQDAAVLSGNYNSFTGEHTFATADFSGDGNVDFVDAGALSGNYNSDFQSVAPDDVAPQVVNVIISGTSSTHDPYDFASEMLSNFTKTGDQLKTVPVGGANRIEIAFSEDIDWNRLDGALEVTGLQTGRKPEITFVGYDDLTFTATWDVANWTSVADQYLIHLKDTIHDLAGNALDGEWTNPMSMSTTNSYVSQFPSGDDIAGGDFSFAVTILPGDANRDGVVDGFDMSTVAGNWLLTGQSFTSGDFDGGGEVNGGDLNVLAGNWLRNLQDLLMIGDRDADFEVDQNDYDAVFSNLGMSNPTYGDGDLDEDGDVDFDDLDIVFGMLGTKLVAVA